jgi:hypothetical protein
MVMVISGIMPTGPHGISGRFPAVSPSVGKNQACHIKNL